MKSTEEIEGWFSYAKLYEWLLAQMPSDGTFVELGAWLGKSSSCLCDLATTQNIFIVDSWLGSESERSTTHKLAVEQDIYKIFLDNMGDRRFTPMRMTSREAADLFEDESVDAAFIDLEHTYEAVKEDISLWLPKIKADGFLAGHDYSPGWPGVIQAVDELLPDRLIVEDCWLFYKTDR